MGSEAPPPVDGQTDPSDRRVEVIVIVNPTSGGNAAGEFLKLPAGGLEMDALGGRRKVRISGYSILDPGKAGFLHLAEAVVKLKPDEHAWCIVAGGDGTVMWVIEEMFKHGVDVDKVNLGTTPFGTGNDFSNVTGWGTRGPSPGFLKEESGFSGMRRYVDAWLQAEPRPYDIWETSVRTMASEKAGFEFIQDGRKVCTDKHIDRHGIKRLGDGSFEMSKYVCNYFSVGLDARVGVGFDKLRAKSQAINKGVYGWEGAKKLLFKKKGVIGNVVDSLEELHFDSMLDRAAKGHKSDERAVVFKAGQQDDRDDNNMLMGNPVSLIFMNIPSIAGGLDIWKWSKSNMGITGPKDLLDCPQDFGDGKLECLSYRSGIGFYLEQLRAPTTISGRGNRIYQGGEPLRLKFKSPSDVEFVKGTSHCKGRTYMQVDGEFFIVYEPHSLVVKHHAKVRVLVNMSRTAGCFGAA
jgi:diacylglycerol kinase (ATP)